MDTQFFPHFIRMNIPEIEITNEEAIEIGEEFKIYLKDIFKDTPEKLEAIWNITPINVIPNIGHPLKTNGYEPALVLHFCLFVEKMKNVDE